MNFSQKFGKIYILRKGKISKKKKNSKLISQIICVLGFSIILGQHFCNDVMQIFQYKQAADTVLPFHMY